eukprot:Blabericola_migrator_1__1173@NODE_12_length_24658_cov_176_683258_g9_i0_p15_GENE_NODE_12_length_24658_cov_176_683258_g9_i0NODE_12_length_24658_cov_176_683258_g9_i0_p15_ORF_typecomplete_len198_score42_32Phagetail_3/PF13550_6/0_015_NODE_12_length_24658_cov_176_683258_g9_i02042721020
MLTVRVLFVVDAFLNAQSHYQEELLYTAIDRLADLSHWTFAPEGVPVANLDSEPFAYGQVELDNESNGEEDPHIVAFQPQTDFLPIINDTRWVIENAPHAAELSIEPPYIRVRGIHGVTTVVGFFTADGSIKIFRAPSPEVFESDERKSDYQIGLEDFLSNMDGWIVDRHQRLHIRYRDTETVWTIADDNIAGDDSL